MLKSNTNMLLKKLNAKDKDKWPLKCQSWKRRAHSFMKWFISRLGAPYTSMVIRIKWCPSWDLLYLRILVMVLCFATAHVGQLMTFENTVSHFRSITTTLATKTWSFWVMYRLACNETPNVKAYHHVFHTACPRYQARACMTSQMTSCVTIHWPPNMQQAKCVPNASNLCPHSHVKRLDAKGWIKPKQKCNIEVKVECVMQIE
jgi:hypothetical protein